MLEFKNVIVRKPCKAMLDGITTEMFGEGKPVYEKALEQHANYVKTLEELGAKVLVLDGLEEYPDSCFVEDPAVVMKECAVITNSSAESRVGERYEIMDAIKQYYDDEHIFEIKSPGTMEGGDVMLVGKHFYVGQSDRTNAEGAKQFAEIVGQFGYEVTPVPVTEGLHLKDFVIYLENNNMLVSQAMDKEPAFADFNKYVVEPEELYAINSLYFNDTVLVPAGFPKTLKAIQDMGYKTQTIDTTEFKLIDGSLTCLSLRF